MLMLVCITPGDVFDSAVIVVVLLSLTTELSTVLHVLCMMSHTPVIVTVTTLLQCIVKVCFMLCL